VWPRLGDDRQSEDAIRDAVTAETITLFSVAARFERIQNTMARLLEQYKQKVMPALREQLSRQNPHSLPRLEKIVVSMGVGAATQDRKLLDEVVGHLALIVGQKPQITRSRKAVAAFRLREGMDVGCRVTLRGRRMYEFLDRLISLALPRVRDFRGLNPRSFDGRGNYSMGLNEQLVFAGGVTRGLRYRGNIFSVLDNTPPAGGFPRNYFKLCK